MRGGKWQGRVRQRSSWGEHGGWVGQTSPVCYTALRARGHAVLLGMTRRLRAHHLFLLRETLMADAPSPDALLSQSLAVLRQCVPTLETAAARAPARGRGPPGHAARP